MPQSNGVQLITNLHNLIKGNHVPCTKQSKYKRIRRQTVHWFSQKQRGNHGSAWKSIEWKIKTKLTQETHQQRLDPCHIRILPALPHTFTHKQGGDKGRQWYGMEHMNEADVVNLLIIFLYYLRSTPLCEKTNRSSMELTKAYPSIVSNSRYFRLHWAKTHRILDSPSRW